MRGEKENVVVVICPNQSVSKSWDVDILLFSIQVESCTELDIVSSVSEHLRFWMRLSLYICFFARVV